MDDKPSVTIVGLKGNQVDSVKSSFGDQVDLKFVKDRPPAQIRATAESSDYVVLMTKFVSHNTLKALKGCDMEYCHGGTSSLELKLTEILSRS